MSYLLQPVRRTRGGRPAGDWGRAGGAQASDNGRIAEDSQEEVGDVEAHLENRKSGDEDVELAAAG